jgi:hypothetical protein
MQDFTDSSILAYECGYTEESLKQQLIAVMQHQVKQEVTELTEEQQQVGTTATGRCRRVASSTV